MTCGENSEDSTKKTVRTDKWIQQNCKIQVQYLKKKKSVVDFSGGPVVESLPANAGDMGLILGPGGFHTPQSN